MIMKKFAKIWRIKNILKQSLSMDEFTGRQPMNFRELQRKKRLRWAMLMFKESRNITALHEI